jgi:stage V sporulation protein SpoVS
LYNINVLISNISKTINKNGEQKMNEEISHYMNESAKMAEIIDNKPSLKVAADARDISPEERKKNVKKLAGAISHSLRTCGEIYVRAFGSACIGKSAKALAIAKSYISETHNLQLAYSPAFLTAQIGGSTLTGICFCTFTQPKDRVVDFSKVKSVLMVKADPKDIGSEDRKNNVKKLAGAITHAVEDNKECLIRCFGNASISKAAKALAIARGFTATRGPDLYCWDDFIITKMGDNERTGICYYAFDNSI